MKSALSILDENLNSCPNRASFVLQAELENIDLGISRNIDFRRHTFFIRSFDYKGSDLEKSNLGKNLNVKFESDLDIEDLLEINSDPTWSLKLKI